LNSAPSPVAKIDLPKSGNSSVSNISVTEGSGGEDNSSGSESKKR
jgi:hypothetical protein